MRDIKRDEVPEAGADDLPAPEIAVSHPVPPSRPLAPRRPRDGAS